jgi:DNA-binding NtrC family response regulator
MVPVSSRLDAILEKTEQQMIEDALAVAEGRVSGGSGAAQRLGVPASTLEAKIRRYGINNIAIARFTHDPRGS